MLRCLSTMVLSGILGSIVLAGNAEACHRTKCTGACKVVTSPAPCVQPAPCVVAQPCAPKVKRCFKLSLPKLCHRSCGTCGSQRLTLACVTGACYGTVAPVGYAPIATPQASAQH
jgi:hypothetical protein